MAAKAPRNVGGGVDGSGIRWLQRHRALGVLYRCLVIKVVRDQDPAEGGVGRYVVRIERKRPFDRLSCQAIAFFNGSPAIRYFQLVCQARSAQAAA
jgi:hypothetical protein